VEEITGRMKQTIDEHTRVLVKEMYTKNLELIKFIQLEFVKGYQVQQKIMDQTCSNLFTLKPQDAAFFKKSSKWMNSSYSYTVSIPEQFTRCREENI
jgi:uncharacterized membrane protein YheB (UPF0754 family)